MITKTKQNWTIGATVKVGFLTLIVRAAVATPGDFAPDAYILSNTAGDKLYKFVPHNGCERINVTEARDLIAASQERAQRIAAEQIAKSQAAAREIAAINELLFA